MDEAAKTIGNPQNRYKSFHVAGTNGKGSTCAYIESALRNLGYTTGLFMSPHIIDFEERFIINGRPVETQAWVDVYKSISPVIEELSLTFFEATALLAFELFSREKIDFAVFETGMGGRLDATNIITPVAAAITSISVDHREFLGNDVAAISNEKLGIVKRQVPCIMAFPESEDVRENAESVCRARDSALTFARVETEVLGIQENAHGMGFTYKNQAFAIPLFGLHQVHNALLAIKTLEAAGFTDLNALAEGMAKTFLPGRFQAAGILGKTVVFDVGHNPDAAAIFTNALSRRFPTDRICIVAGIMKDKDCDGMFLQYCRRADTLLLTQPKTERSAPALQLQKRIPSWFKGRVIVEEDVGIAVKKAIISEAPVISCVGSFYTVGEAMQELGIRPYDPLGK